MDGRQNGWFPYGPLGKFSLLNIRYSPLLKLRAVNQIHSKLPSAHQVKLFKMSSFNLMEKKWHLCFIQSLRFNKITKIT